jgi:hypothetical protein
MKTLLDLLKSVIGRGIGREKRTVWTLLDLQIHFSDGEGGVMERSFLHPINRQKDGPQGCIVIDQRLNVERAHSHLVSDSHLRVSGHHELDACTGVTMDSHFVADLGGGGD